MHPAPEILQQAHQAQQAKLHETDPPPTLDRPKAEFSGFAQGDGLVTPPDFVSMIGTLLPIAPCGRSSL